MNKIIVATDFSDQAAGALDHALNVARHTGAEVLLVHALDETMRTHYDQVHASLHDLRDSCADSGVSVSVRTVIGYADTAIASTAADVQADLVVLGTHGRTGVDRFLMGSVAERAVRLCPTCVMVARGKARGEGGYRHVLVPTDFSESAEATLRTARVLICDGGVIELFHSWQLPGAVTGYWGPSTDESTTLDPLRRELRESAEARCRALIERAGVDRDADARVVVAEVEDSPTHGIRRRLESGAYDLVVMGSHGRRGFRRWMLGSVAETTVRYAPCSVLVARRDRDQT